jgi:photosystem II stability/assembly factor-like uncharacterized protein
MHESAGSTRSRWITPTVTVAVLAFAAFTGLGAVPAGEPAWHLDGPGGGSSLDPVFAPSDASRVYVSTYMESFRSDDGGASFERLPTPTVPDGAFLGRPHVDPADRDRLLAAVCADHCRRIVRSLDGGLTWAEVLKVDTEILAADFGSGTPFVSTRRGMLRSDDGGVTWSPAGLEGHQIFGMWFDRRRPNLVIAESFGPLTLWRTEDLGRSWKRMRTAPNLNDFSICFDPVRPGTVYALADRHPLRSTDDGRTWQGMPVSDAFAFQVLGDGTLLLSQGYGLLRSTDGGLTFIPAPGPGNPAAGRPDDSIGAICRQPEPSPGARRRQPRTLEHG